MKTRTPQFIILVLIVCLASLQNVHAISPPPDGGYPGGNTAEGQNALLSLSSGGYNTAVGFFSLRASTTNSFNTAVGAAALLANVADQCTAVGAAALLANTSGMQNTAVGAFALLSNTTGGGNTAVGFQALDNNATGFNNTAVGDFALYANTGDTNVAVGSLALRENQNGSTNIAVGVGALDSNTTGSANIALGGDAGSNLTTGDYNIDIGNSGVAGEAGTIRIGDDNHNGSTFIAGVYGVPVAGLAVAMDSSGHLGTVASSSRFKKEIRPMAEASEAILALNPVTFRYEREIDAAGTAQFGLVAEEVEKVDPDLVVRDKGGKPYTVRYDQVNAMLLNEFLKEHKTVQELKSIVAKQETIAAQQQKQIDALTAGLQKVSAQIEVNKASPLTVLNNY